MGTICENSRNKKYKKIIRASEEEVNMEQKNNQNEEKEQNEIKIKNELKIEIFPENKPRYEFKKELRI